jgi:hypothetical protein
MPLFDPERQRLAEADARQKHWRRWGPYLAERSWGTVREDYSADGQPWYYLTHEQARSRTYRWTEDGLLGICDNHQRLCLALALWNGNDPFLKERLFGLSGPQGNHGEDVKELYYYLSGTPTHSYQKALYKYPQARFPYDKLIEANARRTRFDPEYELHETGVFDEDRYFDVFVEYAKEDVDDILIRYVVVNRGPESASLVVMPTIWFRNTWIWNKLSAAGSRPELRLIAPDELSITHDSLGSFRLLAVDQSEFLFTNNESNAPLLWSTPGVGCYYKDAFHEYLVQNRKEAVNPEQFGTKAGALYRLSLSPGEQAVLKFRLFKEGSPALPVDQWDNVFAARIEEANLFYEPLEAGLSAECRNIQQQASAGLFWSKQFYHFVIETWLNGDDNEPEAPPQRKYGRNRRWRHLFNEDVISMPDKWEYPWYAAWDLGFHAVAIAPADPRAAKSQLALFLREWYMHPNGQIPAYEWSFDDANPPVHAWASWRVFKIDERVSGKPDYEFLERVFHKLLVNFTWWVNRKDSSGENVFEGGFLGLDNIGIFNRSDPLPNGWILEQSDGSSWMAMYCLNMLKIALRLCEHDRTYEDIASKFLEHFLYISSAIHRHGGAGLWDEDDGFYYDRLRTGDQSGELLRLRSMVGLIPLFAADTLPAGFENKFPGFAQRMHWFIKHRPDLTEGLASMTQSGVEQRRLLSVVNRHRLKRILLRVFDEREFLSPYGIRSLSRFHKESPYSIWIDGAHFSVGYEPGESQSGMFGGNSNWRGPVWFPVNFLLIEALQRFDYYYGSGFQVEMPTGSKNFVSLGEAAVELSHRLSAIFCRDSSGRRPADGDSPIFQTNPHFKDYVLFYEFFHGDTGAGLGASHQTGWTGLVAKLMHQSGGPRGK